MAKQPYRPALTSIDIMENPPAPGRIEPTTATMGALVEVKVSTQEGTGDGVVPLPEPRRQLNYRPTISTYEKLRLISFRERRPIQELVDEAMLLWLANKK